MPRIEITEGELFKDLQEALGVDAEDGHTSQELADLMGWGQRKTLDVMKKLILAGSWQRVSVMRSSVLTDITRPVNAYRPVAPSD